MNKRKLLKAFGYDEKKVTAGIKRAEKSLRKYGFSRDEIEPLLNMLGKKDNGWPEKIYKIKTPSPKVARIPEKPAIKIGLVKAWKKYRNSENGYRYQCDKVVEVEFLRKQEARIEKNYIHKDVVERDYIKKPGCTQGSFTPLTPYEYIKSILKAHKKTAHSKLKFDKHKSRDDISPCPHCYCMTKTIKGKCGKCKKDKHRKEKI